MSWTLPGFFRGRASAIIRRAAGLDLEWGVSILDAGEKTFLGGFECLT